MKRIIGVIISMLFVSQAFSIGKVTNAKVVKIRVDLSGKTMIYFDQSIGGTPATCVHDSYKGAQGVDASTQGGKAVLSMALTAKTTNAPVTVYGMGVCGVYGGSIVETWNHGFLM